MISKNNTKENTSFNELSFLTASPSNYNIKTLKFCTLYIINRSDFLELLDEKFEEDLVLK